MNAFDGMLLFRPVRVYAYLMALELRRPCRCDAAPFPMSPATVMGVRLAQRNLSLGVGAACTKSPCPPDVRATRACRSSEKRVTAWFHVPCSASNVTQPVTISFRYHLLTGEELFSTPWYACSCMGRTACRYATPRRGFQPLGDAYGLATTRVCTGDA